MGRAAMDYQPQFVSRRMLALPRRTGVASCLSCDERKRKLHPATFVPRNVHICRMRKVRTGLLRSVRASLLAAFEAYGIRTIRVIRASRPFRQRVVDKVVRDAPVWTSAFRLSGAFDSRTSPMCVTSPHSPHMSIAIKSRQLLTLERMDQRRCDNR
jgi:hypothetical protein